MPPETPQKGSKMQNTLFALSLGFVGVILATHAGFADAQGAGPQCGARDAVLAQLADKYGETRRGIGMAANQSVLEIFAATATGTWTIIVTMPDGSSCLVASGEGYEPVTEALPAKGEPA